VSVRLTESAERDIAHAFEWYEREREDLGYRFMARVDEAIESISENPKLYAPMIGEARRALVEQFPYAIWYRRGMNYWSSGVCITSGILLSQSHAHISRSQRN
jgi:toxin ParE1/3/4